MRLANAIAYVETKGNCSLRGASGEKGCFQYLDSTWKLNARQVLGYVPTFTPTNEKYVAVKVIEKLQAKGYTPRQIALIWNQGHPGACSRGINKYGVEYDSCAYADKVVKHY